MVSSVLRVSPGGALSGAVTVPGDKSISHRAVMLGALADGTCAVRGCLMGEDVVSTMDAFRAMGVVVEISGADALIVHGVGIDGLSTPSKAIDLGNSGTSMRLLCGILAGSGIDATLGGDASLSQRPMRRVSVPLTQMGATIETTAAGTPPLNVRGGAQLRGIDYQLPVASAQVKSAVLLAGLFAQGRTTVRETAVTRDHTERMLSAFGVAIETTPGRVSLAGLQRLTASDIRVPADISSAAFFLVGSAIAPGSAVELKAVGINPTRTGVVDILRLMNANIQIQREYSYGHEPVADLMVASSELQGIDIPLHLVPLAIDEFPAIFIAAACAKGTTVLRGAEELRLKESDRIAVMADGLQKLGIHAETFPDGIAIQGGQLHGGTVDACGDHRVAMAFAMSALRSEGAITIDNAAAIATSFPKFAHQARTAGLRISDS